MGSVSLARLALRGALEAVGKPGKRGSGVNVAYRLVASMHFNPSSKRWDRLRAGTASASRGVLGVLVRNAATPPTRSAGSVRITGGGGAWDGTAGRQGAHPPGKLVRVKLASTRGLRRGSYSARGITLPRAAKGG